MITSDISKAIFFGNGAATDFPFDFKVWEASELLVEVTAPEGDSVAAQGWTVQLSQSGGTVHYSHEGAPLPQGYTLTILRNMPFSQEVDLINGTRFDPAVIEDALDKATAERQQLREAVARSVKLEASSLDSPEQLVQELREGVATSLTNAAIATEHSAIAVSAAEQARSSAEAAAASAAEAGYAAGEEAVQRVIEEGDTQVARVQERGEKVFSSVAELTSSTFMPGMVVAFSGSFGGPDNKHPIPTGSTEPSLGWQLHEPSRGKFILGGSGANQGEEGGSTLTHGHTLSVSQMPNHAHSLNASTNAPGSTQALGYWGQTVRVGPSTYSTGGSQSHSHGQNLPPYYVLAYIEKLPAVAPSEGSFIFVQQEELNEALSHKQDKLVAGENIRIEKNVIHADGKGGVDFSLEEQDTGLKAVDGSIVYQKNILVEQWDGSSKVLHGITALKGLLRAEAFASRGE